MGILRAVVVLLGAVVALLLMVVLALLTTPLVLVFAIWLLIKMCLLKPRSAMRALGGLIRIVMEHAPKMLVTGATVAGFFVLILAADGTAEHCVSYLDRGSVAILCEQLEVGFFDAAYQESRNLTHSLPVLAFIWALGYTLLAVFVEGRPLNPPGRTEKQVRFLARRGIGLPVSPHERERNCPRWHTCHSHTGMCFCDVVWHRSVSGLCVFLERKGVVFWLGLEPVQDKPTEDRHGSGQPVACQEQRSE